MDVDHLQLDLIEKSKRHIIKATQKGLDISCFADTYFTCTESPGYSILEYFIYGKKKLLNRIYIYLKSLYSIRRLNGYKTYNSNKNKFFRKIVVSWSKNINFLEDGSYKDKYFDVNSKENKEILWFLISLDNKFPNNLEDNIVILSKKDNNEQSLIYLIKIFFSNLFKYKLSIKKFVASLSFYSHISKIIFKNIKPIILRNDFDTIIMPYESHPFQNYLFKNIRNIKKNIKTIGYMHSTQPFPSLNLYRDGAPEKIFVHGSDQKFYLTKYLGWPSQTVNLIPSLRFKKQHELKIENKIFLPIFISNSKIYLNEFKGFLLNLERKIKPLTVINHPQMQNSKPHLNLEKKLNALIKANKEVFSEDSKQSETLIFGATSLVLEALEREYKFTHICAEPILESYTKVIWPSIAVTKINDYVFNYSLKNFGSCVNLGIENNMFQKYCIN